MLSWWGHVQNLQPRLHSATACLFSESRVCTWYKQSGATWTSRLVTNKETGINSFLHYDGGRDAFCLTLQTWRHTLPRNLWPHRPRKQACCLHPPSGPPILTPQFYPQLCSRPPLWPLLPLCPPFPGESADLIWQPSFFTLSLHLSCQHPAGQAALGVREAIFTLAFLHCQLSSLTPSPEAGLSSLSAPVPWRLCRPLAAVPGCLLPVTLSATPLLAPPHFFMSTPYT